MANDIKAAEMIEAEVVKLKSLLAAQERIAEALGGDEIDKTILHTKELIEKNEATAKHIRETAE